MSAARLLVFAAVCAVAGAGHALAGGVTVPMDEATVVTFKRPVVTVYVGNSSIAEINMIDNRHAFVLGKRFGSTNLIALASDKSVVVNEPVVVSGMRVGAVTVNRGAQSYNYTCTRLHCEAHPVPGDPKDYFDNTEGPATEHEEAGARGANPGMQSQH